MERINVDEMNVKEIANRYGSWLQLNGGKVSRDKGCKKCWQDCMQRGIAGDKVRLIFENKRIFTRFLKISFEAQQQKS